MNRAERIKEAFLNCKTKEGKCVFSKTESFECGDHIAYEMEKDYKTMKYVLKELTDYLTRHPIEKFGDIPLKNAIESLEKRINEF